MSTGAFAIHKKRGEKKDSEPSRSSTFGPFKNVFGRRKKDSKGNEQGAQEPLGEQSQKLVNDDDLSFQGGGATEGLADESLGRRGLETQDSALQVSTQGRDDEEEAPKDAGQQ